LNLKAKLETRTSHFSFKVETRRFQLTVSITFNMHSPAEDQVAQLLVLRGEHGRAREAKRRSPPPPAIEAGARLSRGTGGEGPPNSDLKFDLIGVVGRTFRCKVTSPIR
jgi:hypothetical protein